MCIRDRNDIERATEIARKMVTQYGMSDKLGPINYGGSAHEVFIGKDLAQSKNYSEEVASQIDEEIKNIVHTCYEKCEQLLRGHFDTLTRVANALIAREKISGEEFEKLFEGTPLEDEEGKTPGDTQTPSKAESHSAPENPASSDENALETEKSQPNKTIENKQEE